LDRARWPLKFKPLVGAAPIDGVSSRLATEVNMLKLM
jgi:hypothetical protein